MRSAATVLSVLACLLASATPAFAGEAIDGRGWSLEVPDGFVEMMSMEGGGRFNVSSRFGTLPIEGVPEMKAYVAGDPSEPKGVLVVSRIDLTQEVLTADEMGMDRLHLVKDQMPEGARIEATTIGKWNAVEMSFVQEVDWESMTSRMIVIAAGDYCVAVVLMTNDEAFPQSAAMWTTMKSSIDVDPPINKWVLFALVGFGALGALWALGKFGSRQVRDIPDHESRWKRHQDGGVGDEIGAIAAHKPMQTGVRPKVLPSSGPRFDPDDPLGAPPLPPSVRALPKTTPAPTPTDASVTRPTPESPAAPKGLRATRPASGRYGH